MASKKPGKIKSGQGTLIGNAGEYYVMAELLKRGVVAGLLPRNAPAFDILATKGGHSVRIRVKTKSAQYDSWRWVAKEDKSLFRDLSREGDHTVLVNLSDDTRDLEFYVIPTHELNKWLCDDFEKWCNTPGKNGRPHDPENKLRALCLSKEAERLEPHRNGWDSLWL
jgi:hypothetical protein